jgi:hypothetical protein
MTDTLEERRTQVLTLIKELTTQNRGRNEDLVLESIARQLETATNAQGPLLLVPFLKNLLRIKLSQVEDISNLMCAVSALTMVHAAIEDFKQQTP